MAVRLKPMQRDLFTGELVKKPKAGRGDHIKLKTDRSIEPVVVPGMAHFAGTGPEGKMCRDCEHLADVAHKTRTGMPKIIEGVCMKARHLIDKPDPIPTGGLHFERSCKYFKEKLS